MRSIELSVSAFWFALGIAVCAQSWQLGMFGAFGPDSGFFPFFAGTVLSTAAMLLLVFGDKHVSEDSVFWGSHVAARRVMSVTGLMAIMILLTPHTGFLLAGCIATPIMIRAVGGASWVMALAIGLGAPLTIHVLFTHVLSSPLPSGLLRGII
jgi:putative tricarboxylic transport membrane protein